MGATRCDLFSVDKDTLCAVHWFDENAVESDADTKVKQSLYQQWSDYIDEQIIIALMCTPSDREYSPSGFSLKLALWSFSLNLFKGE